MSISWVVPSVATKIPSIISIRRALSSNESTSWVLLGTSPRSSPSITGISWALPSVAMQKPKPKEHEPGAAFHTQQRKHQPGVVGDVATESANIRSISWMFAFRHHTKSPNIMIISRALHRVTTAPGGAAQNPSIMCISRALFCVVSKHHEHQPGAVFHPWRVLLVTSRRKKPKHF